MSTKAKVDQLWRELREAINKAYADSKGADDLACLRDYAENISWSDDLAALLGREAANERQHRRNRPSPNGFSVDTAAKLILMNNMVHGRQLTTAPSSLRMLQVRHTAFEAEIIGYLCADRLTTEWCATVESLDYSKLMQAA